ncbi:hypothetical protein LOTGIDRAFT_170731 [Lottia gigantea]|uniref:Death domain-containing protein n=1 Tax=Lottia gigantea TaxID=225164 RepID=V4BF90_LOTGI|nr:hypothetical protein LOTGIDRAFT_170731 [Lottia gigantea]ESP04487.1 hypothetical protein LOTGIDRAFT_170731 [Lottia gigantea]
MLRRYFLYYSMTIMLRRYVLNDSVVVMLRRYFLYYPMTIMLRRYVLNDSVVVMLRRYFLYYSMTILLRRYVLNDSVVVMLPHYFLYYSMTIMLRRYVLNDSVVVMLRRYFLYYSMTILLRRYVLNDSVVLMLRRYFLYYSMTILLRRYVLNDSVVVMLRRYFLYYSTTIMLRRYVLNDSVVLMLLTLRITNEFNATAKWEQLNISTPQIETRFYKFMDVWLETSNQPSLNKIISALQEMKRNDIVNIIENDTNLNEQFTWENENNEGNDEGTSEFNAHAKWEQLSHMQIDTRFFKLIDMWHEKHKDPSLQQIITALKEIGRNDLVNAVQNDVILKKRLDIESTKQCERKPPIQAIEVSTKAERNEELCVSSDINCSDDEKTSQDEDKEAGRCVDTSCGLQPSQSSDESIKIKSTTEPLPRNETAKLPPDNETGKHPADNGTAKLLSDNETGKLPPDNETAKHPSDNGTAKYLPHNETQEQGISYDVIDNENFLQNSEITLYLL